MGQLIVQGDNLFSKDAASFPRKQSVFQGVSQFSRGQPVSQGEHSFKGGSKFTKGSASFPEGQFVFQGTMFPKGAATDSRDS
jgi:hypothetical protein